MKLKSLYRSMCLALFASSIRVKVTFIDIAWCNVLKADVGGRRFCIGLPLPFPWDRRPIKYSLRHQGIIRSILMGFWVPSPPYDKSKLRALLTPSVRRLRESYGCKSREIRARKGAGDPP